MRRGQTLVLLSLTVLLVALMVLMTLSLGAKVRDRMDLQTVADASAYSNALATARTLNTIAIMNRAMIAHTVSTIGTVSLISYATQYYVNAKAAQNLYLITFGILVAGAIHWQICAAIACSNHCHCACGSVCPVLQAWATACWRAAASVGISLLLMSLHVSDIRGKLDNDSMVYANETLPRWRAENNLYTVATDSFDQQLRHTLNNEADSFAVQYLNMAKLSHAQSFSTAVAGVNSAELDRAVKTNSEHGGDQPYHAAAMAMGTRGHPFVPYHHPHSGDWTFQLTLPHSLPNLTWVDGDSTGRGYVNAGPADNPNSMPTFGHPGTGVTDGSGGIWAHDKKDHTRVFLLGVAGGIALAMGSDDIVSCYFYGPIAIGVGAAGEDTEDIMVGPHQHSAVHGGNHGYVAETFPSFYDMNQTSLLNGDDLYGQPRTLAMVSKTPAPITENPWDLSIHMTPNGNNFNASVDLMNKPQLYTGGKQLALGAGVTYYGRTDHHTEPPNLFAPFWHGTLGRLTIDRPARGSPDRAAYDSEIMGMLNGTGSPFAASTYDALSNAGYLGFE